jgi:hypothetical protein
MSAHRTGRAWSIGLTAALVVAAVATSAHAGPAAASDGERDTEVASLSAAPTPRTAREAIGLPPAEGRTERPAVSAPPPLPDVSSMDRFGSAASRSADPFDLQELPGRLSDERLRELWQRGVEAERAERLLESAHHYELIAGEVPEESYTYWRIARNYWRHGESLPLEDEEGRIAAFELAESWAGRGISIDPECAACMLWKFVAMGRQATTRGLLSAVRDAREMDALLTRGIALQPDHRDGPGNSTLGNLYYAGAVFYRVVPDWWWLRLFVGVRGDMDRSLDYARRAVALSHERIDYRVELGAVLLCMGTVREEPSRIAEGMAVLREARALDDYLGTDRLDKAHAATLMEAPAKACGYSRDGFIDMDALKDEARAHR